MMSSPARRAAFQILNRVEQEDAFASILLAALDDEMRDDDRALCHELVLGVLRRRLWLDSSLAHFANRPIEALDLQVRSALRLGLYQLRFLSRIPASAAVNESVQLVREARLRAAAAFANAVLRRAAREQNYDPTASVTDPALKLAIESSHPPWLIERWINSFGLAETRALANANNEAAPLAFRLTANSMRQAKRQQILARLANSGARLSASKVSPDAWRVFGAGKIFRDFANEGLIYFQDEASQLIAHLVDAKPGDRLLDVCAAPGSKTTQIAALESKAIIVAGDLHQHRLRKLRQLANIQGCKSIGLVAYDAARALPFADASFDRVLVDAPCSGTGTLRRNPEIRWKITPDNIRDLAAIQSQILDNAASTIRAGGSLFYSTCSIEIDENENVVRDFRERHPSFQQAGLEASRSPSLQLENGAIRTWPHRQDVDGFFITAFRRDV